MSFRPTLYCVAISAIILLTCCGPDTSGLSPQETGLTREIIGKTGDWQISGITTQGPENPAAIVVFIHGTPGSADAWSDMLSQSPPFLKGIAIDRPGYGETKPNDPVSDLAGQAQAVIDVTKSIQLRSQPTYLPIVLVGHSYGAPVAVKAALQKPDMFHAVILAAGALDPDLEKIHWAQKLATKQPVKFLIGHTLRTANAELMALEDELRMLQPGLAALNTPIYIIHGTDDDLVPFENVSFIEDQFPQAVLCKTVALEGQNHFLPWNEIDAFWSLIIEALKNSAKLC